MPSPVSIRIHNSLSIDIEYIQEDFIRDCSDCACSNTIILSERFILLELCIEHTLKKAFSRFYQIATRHNAIVRPLQRSQTKLVRFRLWARLWRRVKLRLYRFRGAQLTITALTPVADNLAKIMGARRWYITPTSSNDLDRRHLLTLLPVCRMLT